MLYFYIQRTDHELPSLKHVGGDIMKLEGKKIAIFVEDLYEDREFWYPYYRMVEEGAHVVVVGPRQGSFQGKRGLPAKTDLSIEEANPSDFDGLVIPGGYAPDLMRRSKAMVDFVREMHDGGKVIAAICHAGWMLVSADILKGKKVTGFFAIRDDLVNAGAEWFDREVVRDGNLVTSRTPDDLPAFCRTIIEALSG
jgi:protease I